MSLNPDYYTQQLKEIQQELREDSSFHYGCKRFYRIVGILKRRPEVLSSESLVNICKETRDEIFKKKHGSSFSKVYGLIWFILLMGLGATLFFFSQTSGTITFFFTFKPSIKFFIDNIAMGFLSQIIILGAGFPISQFVIGGVLGIKLEGFYIGHMSQPCLKKEFSSYLLAGDKRILFFSLTFISASLWLLVPGLIMIFLWGNQTGLIVTAIHFFFSIIMGIFFRKGEFYRIIRETKISRERKILKQMYKNKN